MRSFSRRASAAALVAGAVFVTSANARAEPDEPDAATPPPSLAYRAPAPPDRLRALALEGIILGLGFGEYLLDKSNSRDFDLSYDWPSLRSKILFDAIAFDDNHFATNFLTHPMAGYAYYSAARANRLTIGESFLFASVTSTLWEYVGEWREQASINDLVVTPVSGVPVGEAFFHLGALFQRSRRSVASTSASWLFGAPKNAMDALDGATPTAPPGYDDLGYPDDVWHCMRASMAMGVTAQDRGVVQSDVRVSIDSRVVELPAYGAPGRVSRWFDEGEVSAIAATLTTAAGRLTDASFRADVMPVGYYEHDVDARGAGHTTIVGLETGFEYGTHDYDRDRLRPPDRVSMVDVGLGFEHTARAGAFALRSAAHVDLDFAGVGTYALGDYTAAHGTDALVSVVRDERYAFAVGPTAWPEVVLAAGPFEAGGAARLDWLRSVDALDREHTTAPRADTEERRVSMRGWLAVAPAPHVRLEASAERRQRNGRVADVTASRGETSLFGSLGVVF